MSEYAWLLNSGKTYQVNAMYRALFDHVLASVLALTLYSMGDSSATTIDGVFFSSVAGAATGEAIESAMLDRSVAKVGENPAEWVHFQKRDHLLIRDLPPPTLKTLLRVLPTCQARQAENKRKGSIRWQLGDRSYLI